MTLVRIAFRNILRNGRRTAMTLSAIAIGAAAMLCLGQFIAQTALNFQTGVVRNSGHLAVFRKGYFDFGSGNPSAYGIPDYDALIRLIRLDPELGVLTSVVTPQVNLVGVAGNYSSDASTTVAAVGVDPESFDKMRKWDAYGVRGDVAPIKSGLDVADQSGGVIGIGLARILGLCDTLKVTACPKDPHKSTPAPSPLGLTAPPSFVAELAAREKPQQSPSNDAAPIDLLTATANGAPNVARLNIRKAERQGIKQLDDAYIRMNFREAQQLLFGRGQGQAKANAVVIQLHRTQDIARAKLRLQSVIAKRGLDLEVRDLNELNPFYLQSLQFLQAVFLFLAANIGGIVLFTVVNTMSMTVMERTNEIGTGRAIGVRRGDIRLQFLLEGSMLGGIGASVGTILAQVIGVVVNSAGVKIVLPGTADAMHLKLLTSSAVWPLVGAVWVGLVAMSILAAVFPANRAARMVVVDALRHV